MAKNPPFDLDPHLAVRDPESLPPLLISCMADILLRRSSGGTEDERFISAFNIAAWSLTTAGRKKKGDGWHGEGSEARLVKGTVQLTARIGATKNHEVKNSPDYDKKKMLVVKMAKRLLTKRPDFFSKTWKEAHG